VARIQSFGLARVSWFRVSHLNSSCQGLQAAWSQIPDDLRSRGPTVVPLIQTVPVSTPLLKACSVPLRTGEQSRRALFLATEERTGLPLPLLAWCLASVGAGADFAMLFA